MRNLLRFLTIGTLTFATSITVAHAQEERFRTLSQRIDLVTEEALHIPSSEGAALVGQDCEVPKSEVPGLDALLTLSSSERASSNARHARWGLPKADAGIVGEQLLFHREYIVNHNSNLKIPTYATYRIDQADIVKRTRRGCFRPDVRVATADSATLDDYDEPRFDRGHLVPRADMNRSKEVMINTFVLSNMMPQHDNFNQGIWRTLESAVRAWAVDRGSIHIVTGAVFDDKPPKRKRDKNSEIDRVKPLRNLGIPSHFYKIVLHRKVTGFIDAIAIMLPHTDGEFPKTKKKHEKLARIEKHIVSIDEIEAVSGYDFFPNMPEAQQRAVERSIASGLWD